MLLFLFVCLCVLFGGGVRVVRIPSRVSCSCVLVVVCIVLLKLMRCCCVVCVVLWFVFSCVCWC